MNEAELAKRTQAIAESLKAKRLSLGLSKNKLAQLSGMSVQSISFIEDAVNSPSLASFLRICDALNVQPDCLLCEALKPSAP